MRVTLALLTGLMLLMTAPGQAAPLAAKANRTELGAAGPLVRVAEGCGPGFHRRHWRDRWGYWHWGRCVPN